MGYPHNAHPMKAVDCAERSHSAQKLFSSAYLFAKLFVIKFGKLRPTSYWCSSSPHESVAPVPAIASMVARTFSVNIL